ncbi:MAG: gamma-glutamyltransferase [Polyangiaceae bacterium]|nr:gamma-glutamyltransferase [Polyangiaceae bacterium]MBK8936507.1 gamma-glutamyltransferase [Polyangiaceae bacterium]
MNPTAWYARSVLAHLLALAALTLACKEPTSPDVASSVTAPPALSASAAPTSTADVAPKPRALPKGAAEAPRVALGTRGAVSSQEANATDVGLSILKAGGSAVDAAIAVGFALAVTHPSAGNLGGGGFMVVREASGKSFALDYRETAPSASSRDMYLGKDGKPTKDSLEGPKAAGIPGTVRGFAEAHKRFGKLPWKDLVAPAVALARDGFALDPVTAADLARVTKKMRELGFAHTAKLFERPDGGALAAGEKLVQPELAKVLQAIADGGADAFYVGALAEKMASEVSQAGGVWKASDLAAYRAKWRDPIVFSYRGHEVVTMPPPSSGGVVLKQLLVMSEALKLNEKPWRSAEEIHLFAEAMRRAYVDRNQLLGDPDFVKMPLETLLDPAYLKQRASTIDPLRATSSKDIQPGVAPKSESTQTTHYSVVDEAGNAVSNTTTLNTGYGAKFAIPGTGVLLNNEMDDFAVAPGKPNVFGLVQGETNKIEPGKRMLSSMTPTILSKDGEVRAILGSPGGPTITTTVAQITRALVDYGAPLDKAVPALRAHHQWLPDELAVEEAIGADVVAELEKRGHKITKRPRMGHANCIEVDPETRGFRAVADTTRAGGKAAAY